MIAILSPAKNLDFESDVSYPYTSQCAFLDDSQGLIDILKKKKSAEIGKLMSLSEKLADLNYNRYQQWDKNHSEKNSRPAIFTFNGDAYLGLDARSFTKDDLEYAQKHLRMLSGLYGLLKPLDLMQSYRLEMGTSLTTKKGTNLYQYWGNKITEALNKDLAENGKILVNVASNEYSKVLQLKNIDARIIECQFKEYKNGEYKTIMTYAKKARGMMSRFIIKNKLTHPEDLKAFDYEKYRFQESLSSENELVFTR
jgi:uncharacterized protein